MINFQGHGRGMMDFDGFCRMGSYMGMGNWGGIIMFGLLLLAALSVFLLVRSNQRKLQPIPNDNGIPAMKILDERYARGEIGDDEYRRIKAELKA